MAADNRRDRKKLADDPKRDKEEQVEVAQEAPERQSERPRDAAQDAVGNQGIAEFIGLSGPRPGAAGHALASEEGKDSGDRSLQFGGDDAPVDAPLTIDDLVRSWNPTTKRTEDGTGMVDPLLGLPPEDEAWLASIRATRGVVQLPTTQAPDALFQPPIGALAVDLRPVVETCAQWTQGTVAHRAWAHLLAPPAAVLVDKDGRLVFLRARALALATLLLVDAVDGPPHPLVAFTLDLACCDDHRQAALDLAADDGTPLPRARPLFDRLSQGLRAGSSEARLPAGAAHLRLVCRRLLALPSAMAHVPTLAPSVAPGADDDPLGLDAILVSHTGGPVDPEAGSFDAALGAAEKLAGACSQTRVHGAGLLTAIASVCAEWTSGAPVSLLGEAADALDATLAETLQLLVEVGRASRSRAVALAGLRNGLRRAARGIDRAADRLVEAAVLAAGGVLPAVAAPADPVVDPGDRLDQAWADREPAQALDWLEALAPSEDRDLALAFTALVVDARHPLALRGDRSARRAACDLLISVQRLSDRPHEARALAMDQIARATARRNGMWLAAAALTAMAACESLGDAEGVASVRLHAGRTCDGLGAEAALSLLARYQPPDQD